MSLVYLKDTDLMVIGAEAIAWHLEQGQDNGGISREALALWLRELAKEIREGKQG